MISDSATRSTRSHGSTAWAILLALISAPSPLPRTTFAIGNLKLTDRTGESNGEDERMGVSANGRTQRSSRSHLANLTRSCFREVREFMARPQRSINSDRQLSAGRWKWDHLDRCAVVTDPPTKRRGLVRGVDLRPHLAHPVTVALPGQSHRPKFTEKSAPHLLCL